VGEGTVGARARTPAGVGAGHERGGGPGRTDQAEEREESDQPQSGKRLALPSGDGSLVFHGSTASERIDLSANGERPALLRDVGSIVVDAGEVEQVDFAARRADARR